MKAFLKSVVAGLLAVLLTASAASAQDRPAFSPEELDQMLAPIALYPDPLLSQILMAATYPLEVVQAARWSRANPHLKGQDAARAVEQMDWDPSVKSLVAFPQILHRMDEQLDWTQRLGEAFLEQEPHVMDAIQGLRQRAERAGGLRSNEQMQVRRQDEHILIEPAQPQVVYVPYYDPAVVYGPWRWPAYPPVYWGPPPGYYAWPAYAPGFFWGTGIAISWGFFFGHADWHHRHVNVVHVNPRHSAHGVPAAKPVRWQHDPVHRRNVPYRHAVLRQPFGQQPAVRGDDRSRPTARRELHNAQPGARSATPQTRPQLTAPQTRPQLTAPQPRPERTAPQARDRVPERNARTDIQRPQFRVADPRPAAVAPRAAPPARPVAPAPVARADARPNPPAGIARAAPRRESEPAPRAAPRTPIRESFMTPRAAASAPALAPRGTGSHASGSARAHGGGNQRATSAGRGGGRS
jgi:hypothetical protein